MAFCPDCGNQISPDAETCPNCGKGVEQAAAQAAAPPPAAPPAGAMPPAAPPPPGPAFAPPPPGPVPPMGTGPMPPGPAWPAPVMAKKKTSGLAIASLILAITGFICLPILGPILGLILGIVAKSQIKKSSGQVEGGGLATAGIVLSVLAIVLVIAVGIPMGIWVYNAIKGPFDATNDFIAFVNDGEADAAYDMLSANSPIRKDYSRTEFRQLVSEMKGNLKDWTAFSTSIVNDTATVTVTMEYRQGGREDVDFDLRKESGEWKVYNFDTYDFEVY